VTLSVLFILLLVVLGIYALIMSRTAGQLTISQQRSHLAWFTFGLLLTLAIFIPSPDLFGPDYRFTVNMGQLLLAVDLGPPFLLLGIPTVMLQPLMRRETFLRRLTAPFLLGFLGSVILLFWFLPVFFEAASGNLTIWLFKQVLFLLAGLLLWWPVAGPLASWRPSYPVQLVYLFVVRIPMTILGIIFSSANQLIYSARSFSLEICAPSSVADQQLGGLVMWLVGGMIVFAAFIIVFFRWFYSPEAEEYPAT
jgi:cytochrome c oxidase assembly factor CtaG